MFVSGWGRCFKRAISKWFLSFVSNPEYLAYLLTKYRRRCGWSVKVVIKLAHIKSPDVTENEKAVGLILRFVSFLMNEIPHEICHGKRAIITYANSKFKGSGQLAYLCSLNRTYAVLLQELFGWVFQKSVL